MDDLQALDRARHLLWKERMNSMNATDGHREALNIANKEIGRLITRIAGPEYWEKREADRLEARLAIFRDLPEPGLFSRDKFRRKLAYEKLSMRVRNLFRKSLKPI